ncbi:MAG TPA: aminoglycoside phosphotransferase family protein [Candidatus Limnocylindrales bacterium]|nr:aminoglycoside phosphotransferase family protein [Candidatus Limnocylindrales bacterium]
MPRTVTLKLVDAGGALLGALPPFEVDLPWWMEAADIVAAARRLHGVEVAVLRILGTEPGLTHGGKVSYLAELVSGTAALIPSTLDTADHPLRPDYARPGGPARSLAWAASVLDDPIQTVEQQRTWNLSAIWRLTTARGDVMWLKQVPRFFFHEAAVLSYLDHLALHAFDDAGRMLMGNIPGSDLYDAPYPVREEIARDMVKIQLKAANDLGTLLRLGVPDRRGRNLAGRLRGLLDEPWILDRLNAASAGGLPDTLVHGDLHPGNVCGTPTERTIIDWGDSFIGHPAFDIIRLAERLSEPETVRLYAFWADLWRAAIPDCDPLGAVEAIRPVAALRNAMVYADFLANIEPSEHPYHAQDVDYWLARARAGESR